ncbi:unnamed protein product (macronuclear) [Paramecium tetraurelia]|uniref:Uncharacterized protein n=1 Tax=Paramecium tetraurelia TaxID=5888 RepID=A0DAV2_PARTE|nr:uncharacterized protein GSPATT00015076001 [Paramecium tetraurelia]CAK80169.1 unnamed protein product [Paramecium tetraurelia]|eukprot:XP_001447566.1 hypothetical protein (macronuclear) [Paramecium tetraurelia strain d4-2]
MNKENVCQAFKTVKVSNRELETFVNSRVNQLQRQLQEKEQEIAQLQQYNPSAHSHLIEIKFDTIQAENHQLRNQVNQYEQMIKSIQNKCNSYQNQIETLTNLLQETQITLDFERQAKQALELQQSNIQLDAESEKSAIKTQIDLLRKEKYQYQSQFQEIDLQLKQQNLANMELTQELSTLSNSFSQLQFSYSKLEEKAYELESKNEILVSQLEVYKTQNDQLKSQWQQSDPKNIEKQYQQNEKIAELEAKLRLSYENTSQFQQLLNEKQEHIKKLERQLQRHQNWNENNNILQDQLDKSQYAFEEMQFENQKIAKYQQQQIEQLKRQLEQQSNNNEELIETKQQLKIIQTEFENYKSNQDNKLNEINSKPQLDQQTEWHLEKSKLVSQIQHLSSQVEVQQNQTYDQFRIQIESQMALKYSAEKVQLENQLWAVQDQLNGIQNSIELYVTKISQLNIENDQLREQLIENQNNSKQILILEQQIRNFCVEIEKLKSIIIQKSDQIEFLSSKKIQTEQLVNYVQELERKVNHLSQDNQRLNAIIIQRCKNSW